MRRSTFHTRLINVKETKMGEVLRCIDGSYLDEKRIDDVEKG